MIESNVKSMRPYEDFDDLFAQTMAALAKWQEAEAAVAQAGQDMARDVRAIIEGLA